MKNKTLFLATASILIIFAIAFRINPHSVRNAPESFAVSHSTSFNTIPSTKSGLINFSFISENPLYSKNLIDTHFVYAKVKADAYTPEESQRLPLNICLVIDRSGSMSGANIVYVKKAAEFVANNLSEGDYLSLVIYDDEVDVLLKPSLIQNKNAIISLINQIEPRGYTNLCGGLMEGYNQIRNNYKQGYVNRVLLLSDGLANKGITNTEQINKIAHTANIENGITTSTFGVGIDFNENLMMGIAESGSGNYYFISNPEEIPAIFKQELKGLTSVVAQNALVEIDLPKHIKVLQIYGYQNQSIDPSKVKILLRDIASNEEKSFLFSYVIENTSTENLNFSAILTFDDAIEKGKKQKIEKSFVVSHTDDAKKVAESINKEVIVQYAIFHSNWLMQNAMDFVDRGDYTQANFYITSNQSITTKYGHIVLQDSLYKAQDSSINFYGNNMENFRRMNDQEKKYYQKSNKAETYKLQKRK